MLVTVKSREMQRGMLAESAGDAQQAATHFLAAAHLELVLARDYEQAGYEELAVRSRVSAASCFWRGGQSEHARSILSLLRQDHPRQDETVRSVLTELERDFPTGAESGS